MDRSELHAAVEQVKRHIARYPQASVREVARQIAPDNPEAVRSAYRRRRDREDEVLLRIARVQLTRDPSLVLRDLPDEDLRRVTQLALIELRDREPG